MEKAERIFFNLEENKRTESEYDISGRTAEELIHGYERSN
jgi:hypothetical protein